MYMMTDTIEIHVMKCGEVGVDPAVPRRSVSQNPIAYTGLFRSGRRRIWIPVFTYLIEHPKGNILVDTGWSSEVREHPIHAESLRLWLTSKPRLPEGSAVDEQLAKLEMTPRDLTCVILTHMDVDHANGLRLVGTQHIMASAAEIGAADGHDLRYLKRQWKGIQIDRIPFKETGLGINGRSCDLFGDGTVQIIDTPGHTAGSLTVLVSRNGRSVLIAGDTGYEKKSWRENSLPGPVYDRKKMRKALQWVNEMEQKGTLILAGHDPEIKEQTIEL